ncbi:MAG: hypothetical protein B6I20_01250 [Bacteroidetes bacterium 4572_117]|nr:MAG: hypothetical protein B6I20_01250 [Bacteroidetes bacterium 4572_117]
MKTKKSNLSIALVLLFAFILLSCNNKNEEKGNNNQKIPTQKANIYKPAQFVDDIVCRTDQSQTYAAYFPVSYNPKIEMPIIVVFDAHARGKMAVKKFKKAADEFGYVVVASNNAKNGLKTINKTINALFDDIFYRFKINENRVYTAGFSGGAKIASSIAIYKGGIAGVIAISSGFAKIGQEIPHKFSFASIVGVEDFNYLELTMLDEQMRQVGFPSMLAITPMGHEWPDENVLLKTIEWLEIQSMKRSIIPVNDNLIRNYSLNTADSINKLMLIGKVYNAKKLYEQFLSTIDGLYDITGYQKSYEEFLKNPDIQKQEAEIELSANNESDKQQEYVSLFKRQDFRKLQNEINVLKSDNQTKNVLKKNSSMRLLNYISMLSYIFTDGAINAGDFDTATKYLDIYKSADPNNPDFYYFEACIFANKNMQKEALKSLGSAVHYGFFDISKLESTDYFVKLRQLPEFEELTKGAKSNFEKI